MENFDILSENLNIFGNHFLEASAGTGKTFAIQHLFIRLILETEALITVKDILVVTFTKAATRELKSRIRKNLEKTLFDLKNRQGEPYLQKIYKQGDEKISQAERRLEDALSLFDEANIHTIHSFCYRMLQQCAFELKIPLQLQDPEEQDLNLLCEKSIGDVLSFHLNPEVYNPQQIQNLLSESRGDIRQLVGKIKRLVQDEAQIGSLEDFSSLFQKFSQKFAELKLLNINLEHLSEQLDEMIEAHKLEKLTKQEAQNQKKFVLTLLKKTSLSAEDFSVFLKSKNFFLQFLKPSSEKKPGKIVWDTTVLAFLKYSQDHLLPLIEEAKDGARVLLRLAQDCKDHFKKALEEQEIVSFSGILEKMHRLVQDPRCIQKVTSLFSGVIVDEFQDTDPLQWDIFKTLFLYKKTLAFYLVGDPKQSIYAFRSADVYTYLTAAQTFGKDNLAYLSTNYRSSASLIEALNLFFSSWDWMQLPFAQKTLPYHPVQAHTSSSLIEKPFCAVLMKGSPTPSGQFPSQDLEEELLFPFIAKEIISLQQTKNFQLGAFAVLIKDRYQADRLQNFFKKHHLTSVIKRTASLLDTVAYSLLYDFLHALAYPRHIGVIKKFLASLWFPYKPDDLYGKLDNSLVVFSLEEFSKLHKLFLTHGFASCFEKFLETTWHLLGKTNLSLLIHMHGADTTCHLEQLLEILIQYENTQPCTPKRLFFHLKRLKQSGGIQELTAHQYAAEEAITIMTTHLSKGLEFEVVFAIGVSCRTPLQENYVAIRKGSQRIFVPFDEKSLDCLLAIEESDAEKMRQLYVALTRAKSAVYLPILIDEKLKEIPLGDASPTELFFSQKLMKSSDVKERYQNILKLCYENLKPLLTSWQEKAPIAIYEDVEVSTVSYQAPPFHSSTLFLKPLPSIKPSMETVVSFSSLNESSGALLEDSLVLVDKTLKTDLPVGPEFGVFCHEILEEIILRGIYHPFDKACILELIQENLKNTPFIDYEKQIFHLLEQLFHMSLHDGDLAFTLAQIPPSSFLVEMEFLYPEKEIFVKGFIDAIVEHQGKYYILDWKTNYLEEYHEKSLQQEMQRHNYFLQADLYTKALKKYLHLFDSSLFEKSFGGCFYIFLKGPTYFHLLPRGQSAAPELLTPVLT